MLYHFCKKEKVAKKMPTDAMYADPCAWRYYDYPLIGSIYHLPDIRSLTRGPTIVRLRTGREVRVPASNPRQVRAPAQKHDSVDASFHLKALGNLLQGKRQKDGPGGVPGISYERRRHAMPDNRIFGRPRRGAPRNVPDAPEGIGAVEV